MIWLDHLHLPHFELWLLLLAPLSRFPSIMLKCDPIFFRPPILPRFTLLRLCWDSKNHQFMHFCCHHNEVINLPSFPDLPFCLVWRWRQAWVGVWLHGVREGSVFGRGAHIGPVHHHRQREHKHRGHLSRRVRKSKRSHDGDVLRACFRFWALKEGSHVSRFMW